MAGDSEVGAVVVVEVGSEVGVVVAVSGEVAADKCHDLKMSSGTSPHENTRTSSCLCQPQIIAPCFLPIKCICKYYFNAILPCNTPSFVK